MNIFKKAFFSVSILIFFNCNEGFCEWSEYSTLDISRIYVLGSQVSLTLNGGQTNTLKVNIENSRWLIEKKEKTLIFQTRVNEKLNIEISNSQIPIEVHILDGLIQTNKWTKAQSFNLKTGKIVSRNSSDSLNIHVLKGDIAIFDHSGKLDIDSNRSSINIKNLLGDLSVNQFSGDLSIEKSKGTYLIVQNKVKGKILNSSGRLQFDIQKGSLNFNQFEGAIEGVSQEANIHLIMSKDSRAQIETKTAKVEVSLSSHRTLLSATTIEGEIIPPKGLKVNRDIHMKILKGTYLAEKREDEGDGEMDSITVKSQEGSIIFK